MTEVKLPPMPKPKLNLNTYIHKGRYTKKYIEKIRIAIALDNIITTDKPQYYYIPDKVIIKDDYPFNNWDGSLDNQQKALENQYEKGLR